MGTEHFCKDYYDYQSKNNKATDKRGTQTLSGTGKPQWTDLAPDICRQRMILEGTTHNVFLPEDMTRYCRDITEVLSMTAVTTPICNYDADYGWCAYMHWKESGMHIYSWDNRAPKFFSIDIYTCKAFKALDVVTHATNFFDEDNLIELSWKD